MSSFNFLTARSIVFGSGKLAEVPALVKDFSAEDASVLLVVDARPGASDAISKLLDDAGIPYVTFEVGGEPTTDLVSECVTAIANQSCSVVIGMGGGSVLDTGKAVAALATNGGHPLDYMEVIGDGKPITKPALPYIAIPTTSGTGAEVTKNAVIESPAHGQKVSLRSEFMLPSVALIDPELTISMPPSVTATCGLDAFTHCFEAYVTHLSSPMTDGLAREGVLRCARSIETAYKEPNNIAAREDMAIASLFGGVALANAKLGAVHGFAGVLGGQFHGPHGAVVAATLPASIAINVRALRASLSSGGSDDHEAHTEALRRFTDVARVVTGNPNAEAEAAAEWAQGVCERMMVPGLRKWGVDESHCTPTSEVVTKAIGASSMKGNPIVLTADECAELLMSSLDIGPKSRL